MSMGNPTLMWLSAALLLVAAGAALFSARHQQRAGRVRHAALLGLASTAFFLFLFPPMTKALLDGQLVVLTPGADKQQISRHAGSGTVVALPGVDAPANIPRWPDLASALRHHHDAALHVVGAGLPLRDRDAARGRVARFDAAPLPEGIIELSAPTALPAGRIWTVSGRGHGGVKHVELHDPAGRLVDQTEVDEQGDFQLATALRAAGPALYTLKAMAANDQPIDSVPLGVNVQRGAAISMLVLAGAPDAELKYLRRWAVDSGLEFNARTALAADIALHEGDDALDAARLESLDLLVVDERSWQALPPAQQQVINDAVRAGLGLLLRITGPIDEATQLQLELVPQDSADQVTLDSAPGVSLQPQPWRMRDGAPLLRSSAGDALAAWRWHGQGRIGATWLDGAWPLVLAGDSAAFGSVWADITSTLARAHSGTVLSLPSVPRVGERAVVCGLPDAQAQLIDTQGQSITLLPDGGGCATFWPRQSGWHTINISGLNSYIHVMDQDGARPLKYAAAQLATRRLVESGHGGAQQEALRPLARWPFFTAWLLMLTLLWWHERHRQQPVRVQDR